MSPEELRGLLAKATERPWEHLPKRLGSPWTKIDRRTVASRNLDLIVAAVNSLPQLLASVDRVQELTRVLREIAVGSRTKSPVRCDWCGFDVGDWSETPGHAAACPVAIARDALNPAGSDA